MELKHRQLNDTLKSEGDIIADGYAVRLKLSVPNSRTCGAASTGGLWSY